MMPEPQRWTLDDLLPPPDSEAMEQFREALSRRVEAFERWREKLSPELSEADFVALLDEYEALAADMMRLQAYAHLYFAEDQSNQQALSFKAQAQQFIAQAENRTLFFTLWWKGLEDEAAERLMAVSGDRRYFLEGLRRFKPHTLSEPEERVINIKDVHGLHELLTLYDMLTSRYTYRLVVDGEEIELTRGELGRYIIGADAALRETAYRRLLQRYADDATILGEIYAARVRDWYAEQVELRHFASPIAVRNLSNDIPDEVVETLLQVTRQNIGLFQRYFRFKAKALGMERLRRFDIYAPLDDADRHYRFDEALTLVDESYRAFSPRLADLAKRVIEARHLDAEVRKHKADGAFCYGVLPDLTPWVLVSFDGRIRDVSTLAHELGHAVHAMMAADHSPLTFHASLPLAETASVFGEMLLTDRMLAEEDDPAVHRTLLNTFLSDSYATVVRQVYFVLFEKEAHRLIHEGATIDRLHEAYLENLHEQFGEAVEVDESFRYEWLAIPHIYFVPFYCYAYAFGQLLVLALYRKYKAMGREAFEPLYLRILAHGGATPPEQVLREAGFDMHDPAFWQGGFDLIAEMLDRLEALS